MTACMIAKLWLPCTGSRASAANWRQFGSYYLSWSHQPSTHCSTVQSATWEKLNLYRWKCQLKEVKLDVSASSFMIINIIIGCKYVQSYTLINRFIIFRWKTNSFIVFPSVLSILCLLPFLLWWLVSHWDEVGVPPQPGELENVWVCMYSPGDPSRTPWRHEQKQPPRHVITL